MEASSKPCGTCVLGRYSRSGTSNWLLATEIALKPCKVVKCRYKIDDCLMQPPFSNPTQFETESKVMLESIYLVLAWYYMVYIIYMLFLICMFKDQNLLKNLTYLAENRKKFGSAGPVEPAFCKSSCN